MGRSWTNITFEFDRSETIPEATSKARTTEEALNDFIQDEWGNEFIPPVSNADLMFGGIRKEKVKKYVEKVFSEFEFIDKAGVVSVSDSAHAGEGWVFERSESGSAEEIDGFAGYEGARGSDVAGEIYDNYYIKVDEMWHWD